MYSPSQILYGLRNPRRTAWEIGWLYHRKLRNKTGYDIMSGDWDNLIIIDACRYDMFEDLNSIEGSLSSIISQGSSTGEFLRNNFLSNDDTYEDTVYVSANPQTSNHNIAPFFHETVPLWKSDWDNKLRTVHPSDVTERTVKIHENFPNKRLIIHYVQPHYPFIGEKGKEIKHRTLHGDGEISDPDNTSKSIWEKLENNEVSERDVRTAYYENLELTIPYIKDLIESINGKSIITSDHGNAFGKYGLYGHPPKRYSREVVEVPWLEIEETDRRKIVEGDLNEDSSIDADIQERLSDLGYR